MLTTVGSETCALLIQKVKTKLFPYETRTDPRLGTLLDARFKKEGFQSDGNVQQAAIKLENELSGLKKLAQNQPEDEELPEDSPFLFKFMGKKVEEKRSNNRADAIIMMRQYFEQRNAAHDTDPLQFWKINESQFDGLSRCATKYLSIPSSSVESERIFSKAAKRANGEFIGPSVRQAECASSVTHISGSTDTGTGSINLSEDLFLEDLENTRADIQKVLEKGVLTEVDISQYFIMLVGAKMQRCVVCGSQQAKKNRLYHLSKSPPKIKRHKDRRLSSILQLVLPVHNHWLLMLHLDKGATPGRSRGNSTSSSSGYGSLSDDQQLPESQGRPQHDTLLSSVGDENQKLGNFCVSEASPLYSVPGSGGIIYKGQTTAS
ncbi:uncharacterized protein Dwil_GK27672 [Drosophila willistoni]|uniref:HAT C-terminal dimerisation domain-containing protein n=1 Tax=Drosophila willistoni TaxID=7260 RepID=A0A0Q9WR54_DROWI|nr:uncharacterized protein Dwil_GK27672 [Drosophila willistoni]